MEDNGFKTANDMVNWLMNNKGRELHDNHGRKWKYNGLKFLFKDIGDDMGYSDGLKCVHLFDRVNITCKWRGSCAREATSTCHNSRKCAQYED